MITMNDELQENADELAEKIYNEVEEEEYTRLELILACNKIIATEFYEGEEE